jgi:hypothetical protein
MKKNILMCGSGGGGGPVPKKNLAIFFNIQKNYSIFEIL